MRSNLPALAILLAILGSAPATAKPKKPSVPEAFETALTVFVEARNGHDIADISLDPDDRKGILDVQDAIQGWGRYTLSRSPRDADLILVVDKGREVQNLLRSPTSHSTIQNPSDATQNGMNNNAPDGVTQEKDQLWVYPNRPDGKLKGPIWSSDQERGLNGPNVLLIRRLKDEVEKAYPSRPAKQQPTP